jgi:hypothetical protein
MPISDTSFRKGIGGRFNAPISSLDPPVVRSLGRQWPPIELAQFPLPKSGFIHRWFPRIRRFAALPASGRFAGQSWCSVT